MSSVFKQQCVFLGAYFICLVCIQPTSAARRAADLHNHRGESEKPPNGIFHFGPMGNIAMAGHVRRFLSVRSLKNRWPGRGWRDENGQKNASETVLDNPLIEQQGKR